MSPVVLRNTTASYRPRLSSVNSTASSVKVTVKPSSRAMASSAA
jgi:hypothetical protein